MNIDNTVTYDFDNSIVAMNKILANLHVLWIKTHQAHWYLISGSEGMTDFLILHDWLDKPLDFLIDMIDDVAERIVMINGRPVSTTSDISLLSSISEEKIDLLEYSSDSLLNRTVNDFRLLRNEIANSIKVLDDDGDISDSNKLQDDLSQINKYIWFMQATLGRTTLDSNLQ